ncbi:hypothetical protein KJ641_03735 [Patescibacteria group bacterium]|nr:hypothetical protein [Patescibacteria group bacterium]
MGWARNEIFKYHKTVALSRKLPGILAGLFIDIREMQPKGLHIPCQNPIDMLDQLDRETGTADIVREITKRLHFCLTKAGFPEINWKSGKPQFKNKETEKEWLNTSTYLRQC